MVRLSHVENDNAPGRLCGAEVGPNDISQRILVTCLGRSLFRYNTLIRIGMSVRRRDQPISMDQMPVPVPISKTFMGVFSLSGQK